MKLLDTNILIYAAQENYAYLRPLVSDPNNAVSSFSLLEVLGFHGLKPIDQVYFEAIFQVIQILPITQQVIEKAIEISRIKKISAGDAIIAATALHADLEVQTRNLRDFEHIKEIRVYNPVKPE